MPKSSSLADGAKTYYRPIEAAIRWSGLLRFERRILATLGQRPLPEATEFPRWPMLRLNAERIFDALAHGEMPYGKEGLVRDTQGLAMDDPSLTVRHVDLKAWMAHYYPGEKPTFLFDEIERALHPAISLDTVGALLVEREAIKARLAEHLGVHETLRAEQRIDLPEHRWRVTDAAAGQVAQRHAVFQLPDAGGHHQRDGGAPRQRDGHHRAHAAGQVRTGSAQFAEHNFLSDARPYLRSRKPHLRCLSSTRRS